MNLKKTTIGQDRNLTLIKKSKQLLNMGRCQSNNFDAHIADMTMMQCIIKNANIS